MLKQNLVKVVILSALTLTVGCANKETPPMHPGVAVEPLKASFQGLPLAEAWANGRKELGSRKELTENANVMFDLADLRQVMMFEPSDSTLFNSQYLHRLAIAGKILAGRDTIQGTDTAKRDRRYTNRMAITLPLRLENQGGAVTLSNRMFYSFTVERMDQRRRPERALRVDAQNVDRGLPLFNVFSEGSVVQSTKTEGELLALEIPQGWVYGFVRKVVRGKAVGHPVRRAELDIVYVPTEGDAQYLSATYRAKPVKKRRAR